jgi:Glycyl-tRNA synthetase, beta subunit
MHYFKGLGNYFDKVQRIRKLSGLISDDLLISKEKLEIASSICKVDLLSDLVGEFPELQGVVGGYFAQAQGFDKEVSLAVREHYLPSGIESKIPKKPYSLALSLSDKIDSLVGFFGINLKPTSSKDPYALRRSAIGLIRTILENNKEFKIRDLINYSCLLYNEQNFKFDSKKVQNDLAEFLTDRLKNFMKEKGIRKDIYESAISSYSIDNLLNVYKKAYAFNKLISKEIGKDVIFIYKRASNILSNELKNNEFEISGLADTGLFKNEFEKIFIKNSKYKEGLYNIAKEMTSPHTKNLIISQKRNL